MDARKNIILDAPASRTCVPLAACQPVPSGVTESPESLRIMPRVRPLAVEPPRFENRGYPLRRGGFTLVEMLTVIVIISILAGLITAAAVPAIRRAREATIVTEISQLGLALEKYKQERGDYPPDFAGVNGGAAPADTSGANCLAATAQNAVLQHFRKAFPRYNPGACPGFTGTRGTYMALLYDISYATRSDESNASSGMVTSTINLNPATAMVFMLGGPPSPKESAKKLLGFSANPANPFARGGSRLPILYEFDETRLQIKDEYSTTGVPNSLPALIPPHMTQSASGSKSPYVYFRPRNSSYWLTRTGGVLQLPYFFDSQEQGICAPYAETPTVANDNVLRWVEPTKYQIICAGLDGKFREDAPNPSVEINDVKLNSSNLSNIRFLKGDAANIKRAEDDNITNFTQGKLADRAED